MEPCYACAMAKAKEKKNNKVSKTESTQKGERLFIDKSSVWAQSFSGSKFWLLVVDDWSNMCWSFFLPTKGHVGQTIVQFIKNLRVQKIPVKNIYCDNAGENFSIQKMCEKEEYGNNFEFTGPGSPQYDGKVERKFSTMYGKVRAFLNNAKLPTNFRKGLWAEAMLPTWKMF